MGKLKRASSMVRAPKDMAEANAFLERIGSATRARADIERRLNDEIAAERSAAEGVTRPLDAEIDQLSAGLQLWAEANRPALTRDNATKTVKLAAGEVAWRTRPPKVSIRGAEAVVETLLTGGGERFLRTRHEVDKDAMLREPEAAKKVPGVSIGSEGEDFVVTPANVALPASAVAA